MIDFQTNVLTTYVASWNWLILGWILFSAGVVLIALPYSAITRVFGIAFVITFMFCLMRSYMRLRDLKKLENE